MWSTRYSYQIYVEYPLFLSDLCGVPVILIRFMWITRYSYQIYVEYPLFLSDLCGLPVILIRFMWSTRYSYQIYVEYLLFLSDFNGTSNFSSDFLKIPYIKFHEEPSSGSRVVTDGRTDMTKLIVALRSFANATKNDLRKCPSLACVVTNPRDWFR